MSRSVDVAGLFSSAKIVTVSTTSPDFHVSHSYHTQLQSGLMLLSVILCSMVSKYWICTHLSFNAQIIKSKSAHSTVTMPPLEVVSVLISLVH